MEAPQEVQDGEQGDKRRVKVVTVYKVESAPSSSLGDESILPVDSPEKGQGQHGFRHEKP
jgi:hypothetical protein